MNREKDILNTPITYLKGVGPKKGELLEKELNILTFYDLLMHYPFRYIDKTQFYQIGSLHSKVGSVQLKGVLRRLTLGGKGYKKHLVGRFRDETGVMDLVWFAGVHWLEKNLVVGAEYVVYGQVSTFNNRLTISHPEMEQINEKNKKTETTFAPVYSVTEKLTTKKVDSRAIRGMTKMLLEKIQAVHLPENLPQELIARYKFLPRHQTIKAIHFPPNQKWLNAAVNRLKFEEFFFLQLSLLQVKVNRKKQTAGYVFEKIGSYFNEFYTTKLPFELTGAQKRVIKEIRRDLAQGVQMNRLLQGDVGSGKTMVGLICMLIALDNDFQACMMAPTEILAQQHYASICEYVEGMEINVGFLSGTVKGKKRKELLVALEAGEIDILIGTHAILENPVIFKNLGLAITDEQHRFGVAQRAKLWRKNSPMPPHILVMTATPIPRTLALTFYGDLDVSVIDELPPGRKPVQTLHKTEYQRRAVIGFIKKEIAKGRQCYIVYPLIQESEKLDLKSLEDGYEALLEDFPMPQYQISVVHGKMKAADKDYEMQRFVSGETQIMVATTVIEVGVNVPNATLMVIENAERFGLSQLHQLRGRVGRGADESWCILKTGFKLSEEGKQRIETMVKTTNGFEIAEADLKLRGPGDITGTRQSGLLDLKLADLAKDGRILQAARDVAVEILKEDPELQSEKYKPTSNYLDRRIVKIKGWSKIS